MSDTKNMKVEVSLSDSQIKNVAVGQRVEITSDSLPNGEKVEGEVTEISGVATKSSSLDESNTAVTIKFNDAKNLRPGATINAVIFYKESRNVIKVPYSAVMNENGKFYVFTVDNSSKVTKKEVQIGTNDDSYYEVTSGLSEGDRIISVIDEALKDGEKIKIMDSSKSNGNNANVKSNKKKSKGGGPEGPPM